MIRSAALLVAPLLLACTPADAPPPARELPSETTTPPAPAAILAPSTLAGEWRVAGIDGQPFDEPYGLALSADDKQIWWHPRCVGIVRDYAIDGFDFVATQPAGTPVEPGAQPPPVCAVALLARLPDVLRALDQAERIERTESNGILISGGGHDLLLFSQ